jgi:hypothetical protein
MNRQTNGQTSNDMTGIWTDRQMEIQRDVWTVGKTDGWTDIGI